MARTSKPPSKYKLTLSIDADFKRRFEAFCAFTDVEMSELFLRVMKREMRGFTISHRVGDEGKADPMDGATVRMSRDVG